MFFYLEWGIEGRKRDDEIAVAEVSGNSIKAGFVSRANTFWVAERMGEVVMQAIFSTIKALLELAENGIRTSIFLCFWSCNQPNMEAFFHSAR